MIVYPIGNSTQNLVITKTVLDHFASHQQKRFWHREAGGQLFTQITPTYNQIIIAEATGPRPTDIRSRTSYVPDRIAEQSEINDYHTKGLHYIGDWHTHPERFPSPSYKDESSIRDCFQKSKHDLYGFVLIIVGHSTLPGSLYVAIHDGEKFYPLEVE